MFHARPQKTPVRASDGFKGLRSDNHADARVMLQRQNSQPQLFYFVVGKKNNNNGEVTFSSVVPLAHCFLKVCVNGLLHKKAPLSLDLTLKGPAMCKTDLVSVSQRPRK